MLRPRTRESTGPSVRNKRIAASLGTALVAGAVGVGVGGQSAYAAPVTYGVHCVPPSIGGDPFDFDAQVELTLDPVKPKYNVGDEVTVTWTWKAAATNPSTVTVNADAVKPRGKVLVSGAQDGEVAMEGPQKNEKTGPGEKLWLSAMTGRLKVAKAGEINLAPAGYTSIANMFGSWETPCATTGKPGVGATLSVSDSVATPTMTLSRNITRPNASIAITGSNWPPSAAGVTAQVCDADGKACDPGKASGSTLTVDASGALKGDLRLGDVADGIHQVKIASGDASVTETISVDKNALRRSEPVTYKVHYKPRLKIEGPEFDWEPTVALSVTPQKAFYEVGDEVTVTWKWIEDPRNPSKWVGVLGNTITPNGSVTVSGAQTEVVKVSGPRGNTADAKGGRPVDVKDMTGTFKITKPGQIDLAPAGYGMKVVQTKSSGVPVGTPGVSDSIVVGQPLEATLIAGSSLREPGDVIELSGANWPTGQDNPKVQLCDADGANCTGSAFTAGSGAVAADGTLGAQVTLGTDVAPGEYLAKVTVGATSVTTPITVTKAVVLPREITVSPDKGPSGTKASVTGKNFTPGAIVVVETLDAALAPTGDTVEVTAGPDGAITAELTVTKPGTTQIRASEKTDPTRMALGAFVFEGGTPEEPEEPGTLSLTQSAGGVVMQGVGVSTEAQTMTGALAPLTVTDARKGTLGWQLSGSVSDFTSVEGGTLPSTALSWTPSCVVTDPESASAVVTGSAGPVNGGLLCSAAGSTDPAQHTGGVFTAEAGLSLAIPAYQAAGTYTGTLTLTVS